MKVANVLAELESLVADVSHRHCKLILLTGESLDARVEVIEAMTQQPGMHSINLGSALGRALADLPLQHRSLQAGAALRELCEQCPLGQALTLTRSEILFDAALQLNVLDLLKRQALRRCVITAWPGALHGGRLKYADLGHPEYRDYAVDGVVIHEIK